jgi:hypothetical protein
MCKQLLDPPYHMRLVDAPLSESSVSKSLEAILETVLMPAAQLKDNNKKINSERDKQNEIGRKVLKQGIDADALATFPNLKIEAEDEEQGNAPAKASPQTVTPAHRRILSAKGRSGTSSKKGASSRKREATPVASPVTTGKRKQRSTGATKTYREVSDGEDGEDDSDVSQYHDEDVELAPRSRRFKRSVTKTSKAKAATPTRASGRKSAVKPVTGEIPVRNHAQTNFAAEPRNRRSTLSSVVNASDVEDDQKMIFKKTICKILQIDESFAESYSLEELRSYARAYNIQFATDDWKVSMGSGEPNTCKMFRVFTSAGIIHHFSHVLPKFMPLAIARGDLNHDYTANEHSPHKNGFSTNGNVHEDQALGVLPNPFGLHDQLWNLPQ